MPATAGASRRKARMTSSRHGPYASGDTHATMAGTAGCQRASGSQSLQSRSQFRWGAATRPPEGGVASNRRSAHGGEYVPGPCTHRPSHHGSVGGLKPVVQPGKPEDAVEGQSRDWGEVV